MTSDDSLTPDGGHTSLGDRSSPTPDRSDRTLPNDHPPDCSKLPNPNDELGFPPHSTAPHAAHMAVSLHGDSSSGPSAQPSPVGGDATANNNSNPNLGLQQPGAFPKVSSNFDKPGSNTHVMAPSTALHKKVPIAQRPPDGGNPKPPQQMKSFAEATARRSVKPPDIFTHHLNLIQPIKMTEGLTVVMPEDLYEQRLASFQFALIGRLMLPQGAAPRSVESLKGELAALFNISGDWTLMPLGKGFFSLKFLLQEDQAKAARQTSWKLSVGYMQIRNWKPDFDPYKELSSTAQIWVRLFHLPAEYWHPEFLVGIFRSVGNVIKLDGNTAQGLVGHFARALVEVDLTSPLIDSVRVGLPRNFFFVDFSYENVPLLCTFCNFVGHSVEKCRKAKAAEETETKTVDGAVNKDTKRKRKVTKQWVEKEGTEPSRPPDRSIPTADPPAAGIKTTNTYNALYDLEDDDDEVECVPDTPLPDTPRHNKDGVPPTVSATKENAPHYSAEQLLKLVTVQDSDQDSNRNLTVEDEEAKSKLFAQAQEIARLRQLREELNSKRVATRSTTRQQSQDDSQNTVVPDRQPKKKATKSKTQRPDLQKIESKLQEGRALGKNPTAYELHQGDTGDFKDMEHAVFKHWRDLPDAKDDSDNDEDFLGGSPEASSSPSI